MAGLTPEERQRLIVLLTLLSQPNGRQYLSTIQPILSFIEQKKAQEAAQKEQKDAQNNQLASQIGGTAAGIGTLVLANNLMKPSTPTAPTSQPTAPVSSQPIQATPQAGVDGSGAVIHPGLEGTGSAPQLPGEGVKPVGPAKMPDGSPGTRMEDGAIVGDDGAIAKPNGEVIPAERSPIAGYIQAAGGAAQAYSGYRQYQDGQRIAGGANMVGGAYNMYAGATGNGLQYAPYVGAGVAAANVGQQMANQEGNSQDRAAAAKTEALKAGLLYIPVFGQAAYAALAGVDAVTGGKGTQTWSKFNKRLDNFNNKIDFGLQRSIDNKLFHQSTRGVAKEHTAQLLQQGVDNKAYQDYVMGMRAQHNSGPKDPTKPFAGKYASWDEYQKAGLEAADLTGVYGNIKTYGPAWASLTQEQRQAVTQANINSGLYSSKKGEVEITNEQKARENFDNVIKNWKAPAPQQPQARSTPAPQQPAPAPATPPAQQPRPDTALATTPDKTMGRSFNRNDLMSQADAAASNANYTATPEELARARALPLNGEASFITALANRMAAQNTGGVRGSANLGAPQTAAPQMQNAFNASRIDPGFTKPLPNMPTIPPNMTTLGPLPQPQMTPLQMGSMGQGMLSPQVMQQIQQLLANKGPARSY